MPSEEEISLSQQSLYDSAALRDDLNDTEATILLSWGEGQVARVAKEYPDEFEQKNRFLRQVIKGINRFVGQREFNELEGQKEYLSKVIMYFPQLGWGHVSEEALFAAMPADKKDMFGTLRAILNLLSPAAEPAPPNFTAPGATAQAQALPAVGAAAAAKPEDEAAQAHALPAVGAGAKPEEGVEITNPYSQSLENSNDKGITHDDSELNEE